MEERAALKRLQKQDEQALNWFIDRYGGYVYTVICGILGPDDAAEELSSDVFFALWQSAKQLRGESVKPWLAAVARNTARHHLAAQHELLSLEDDLTLTAPDDVEAQVQQQELKRLLNEALLAMPHSDREIFYRYYYFFQPVKDIAQALDMNPATVKTRLHRGRKQLRERLEQGGYVYETENP